MAQTIRIKAKDGSDVEFVDEVIGQGGMKDVYFSPDKKYVVAFFRDKQDANQLERLEQITGKYRENIFNGPNGEYWSKLFCWPTKIVEHDGRLGICAPTYARNFFFDFGSKNQDFLGIKGKEKEGRWFASASNQTKFLDPRERGNMLHYLHICLFISRATRRMHAAGLAHSDLSYKNVLIDPVTAGACLIDIDGLVVPGKYPPEVVGTPDFIAPEVMASCHLPKDDEKRVLPSIRTDLHALAVLIYMYLFYRHPLRGGKVWNTDAAKDETLGMGEKAMFVEHPTDTTNRPNLDEVRPSYLPWADTKAMPYTIAGPYLKEMFERAFIEGLHEPKKRPTASEWENALVRTNDLMQPCRNPQCNQKWFVFDNAAKPKCPYCGTAYKGLLPVLDFYSSRMEGQFNKDNHRLMVYHNQYIYAWHANRNVFPNEKLTDEEKKPMGYFSLHQGKWVFVNQKLPDMKDVSEDKDIAIGEMVEITDGKQILLSKEPGGRLINITMANKDA
jgi:serine/threonine protein kinase